MSETKMGRKEVLGEHCGNPEQERKSGFPLEAFGVYKEVDGKKITVKEPEHYTVSSCEGRIQGQFEDWVQGNAIELIDKHKGTFLGEKLRKDFAKDYAAGKYFWPDNWNIYIAGEHVRTAMDDAPGSIQLLYLLLKRCHKDMTKEKAALIWRDNQEGVSIAMNWAMGNPNYSAPNQEANGAANGEAQEEKNQEEQEPGTLDAE